jgi:hypothetical protein
MKCNYFSIACINVICNTAAGDMKRYLFTFTRLQCGVNRGTETPGGASWRSEEMVEIPVSGHYLMAQGAWRTSTNRKQCRLQLIKLPYSGARTQTVAPSVELGWHIRPFHNIRCSNRRRKRRSYEKNGWSRNTFGLSPVNVFALPLPQWLQPAASQKQMARDRKFTRLNVRFQFRSVHMFSKTFQSIPAMYWFRGDYFE